MRRVRTIVLGVLCAGACTEANRVAEEPSVTALAVDLPPGFEVVIDDGEAERSPIAAREVVAGSHAVKVVTPCGEFTSTVDVGEGQTATVSAMDFEGLGFAELTVRATKVDGTPLVPTIRLGKWQPPKKRSTFVVPACKLRLAVSRAGLGSFLEDIPFEDGKTYERQVVLARGPEVVRIPGGDFVLGPPQWWVEAQLEIDRQYIGDGDDFYSDARNIPRIPVKVATFDLDRTEVTASQMLACHQVGPCNVRDERYRQTIKIGGRAERHCNFQQRPDETLPGTPNGAFVQPGRGDHPANCVSGWEAREYCKWVGKRLPTDVEFEYAARSGNAEFTCPWGRALDCGHDAETKEYVVTKPEQEVCTRQNMNSTHGVCDLTSNVWEWVTRAKVPGRRDKDDAATWVVGNVMEVHPEHFWRQSARIGFRCARDVAPHGGDG